MNDIERVLSEDLARLLDRLGASVPEGTLAEIRRAMPALLGRMEEAERRLAAEYTTLGDAYGRWRRALDDLENLWALGAWRADVAEEPATPPDVRRAA